MALRTQSKAGQASQRGQNRGVGLHQCQDCGDRGSPRDPRRLRAVGRRSETLSSSKQPARDCVMMCLQISLFVQENSL